MTASPRVVTLCPHQRVNQDDCHEGAAVEPLVDVGMPTEGITRDRLKLAARHKVLKDLIVQRLAIDVKVEARTPLNKTDGPRPPRRAPPDEDSLLGL